MKKTILLIGILLITLLFINNSQLAYSWGFFAHKKINRMAVFTLPEGMLNFYKQHIEYITEHAVDPDKRRYVNKEEGARHYIDMDHYGRHAYDSVPHKWKDAVKKYSEDTLKAYGIVPWYIEKMMSRLTEAFRTENLDLILHYSADIGHYIADSHVPLHTTSNYNGQFTNQIGIHGFWESRIPELKAKDYNLWVGKAVYISQPIEKAWSTVKASNAEVDSVLKLEAKLNATYPADKKYSYENRGKKVIKVYSEEYTTAYNNMLNGMVERRMRASILTVGSMWYTAWVNAGSPNLAQFGKKDISDSLKLFNKTQQHLKNDTSKEVKGHND